MITPNQTTLKETEERKRELTRHRTRKYRSKLYCDEQKHKAVMSKDRQRYKEYYALKKAEMSVEERREKERVKKRLQRAKKDTMEQAEPT